jgi:hypothetical protein
MLPPSSSSSSSSLHLYPLLSSRDSLVPLSHPSQRPRKIEYWKVNNEPFELDSRYTVVDYLGSGAYGIVCSAVDSLIESSQSFQKRTEIRGDSQTEHEHEYGMIAIKKCKNIFESRTMAKRTLREIRILRHLNHRNVCL